MERVEDLLRLVLSDGIGPAGIHRLLARFGDSDRLLGANAADIAATPGITGRQARAVAAAARIDPRPEMDRAHALGVRLFAYDDPDYPRALAALRDRPVILYCRGTLEPADAATFAIVGTRHPTPYGEQQARRFGSLMARKGFTIVSGLALGVDTHAHQGALDAGGRTLAVMGCGLAHIYPESNRLLAAEVTGRGALLSEFPLDLPPSRDTFPRRNRLIAGLAWGTLVVEAPRRSGALITARDANELGREVFALPGRVDADNSAGCHQLIRDGAKLVDTLDDILDELPVPAAPPTSKPAPSRKASAKTAPPAFSDDLPPATIADPPSSPPPARERARVGRKTAEPPDSRTSVPNRKVCPPPPSLFGGEQPPEPAVPSPRPAQRPLRPRPPDLPPAFPTTATSDPATVGDDPPRVLAAMGRDPVSIDTLVEKLDWPVERVSGALLLLELTRAVESRPGKIYLRRS